MSVHQEDGFRKNSRGFNLYWQSWLPEGKKGLVFVLHAYRDHGSRNDSIARLFCQQGLACYSVDLQGHGKSEGSRDYIEKWEYFVEDALAFIKDVLSQNPGIKYFLFGSSMGGAMCLELSLQVPPDLAGLILLAPMCKIADDARPPSFLVPILKAIAYIGPHLKFINTAPPEKCFKTPEAVQAAEADPLCNHGSIKLWMAYVLLRACDSIESSMEKFSTPMLVLHGTSDLMVNISISEELMQRSASTDKTLIRYDGMFHALTWEPEPNRTRVITDILDWLSQRI